MERSIKQKTIELLESNDSFFIVIATPGDLKEKVNIAVGANLLKTDAVDVLCMLTCMIEDLQEKRNKFLLDFITDPAKNEK